MKENSNDIWLLVACHKSCAVPEDPMYLPVHVGSAGKEVIPGFARDDAGDSISEKNPLYCELTGLYWAWKNLSCDTLGLVHYRRYFAGTDGRGKQKAGSTGTGSPAETLQADVLTGKQAEELLRRYRILLPKKRRYYIESIYSHYAHTFDGSQLDAAREILQEQYPEYVPYFDRVMKQTGAYMFNMFIMPKALADEYCAWLFSVLGELEKRVDTSGMTDFEKRYAGRVSERLLNVWLLRQIGSGALRKEEIGEIPVIYTAEVNWRKKISGFLAAKLFGRKYTGSF